LKHFGKVTLYQTELRSLPDKFGKITAMSRNCKPCFTATQGGISAEMSKGFPWTKSRWPGIKLSRGGSERSGGFHL